MLQHILSKRMEVRKEAQSSKGIPKRLHDLVVTPEERPFNRLGIQRDDLLELEAWLPLGPLPPLPAPAILPQGGRTALHAVCIP